MESTSSRKEEINLLIISYLTESISKDDLVRLQQWINMSRENRSYFNAFKNAWTLSGKTGISDSSVDESWITFKEKLTLTKEQEVAHPGKKRPVSKYLRIAASWILFMIIGSAVTWLLTDKPRIFEDVKSFEIIVPLGARSEMKMPDGTKIWLNAGTTITYDENYGLETRTLNLTGEAYFDVSKNESRPFIVQTSEITVRALGTKFNVKAYPEDNTISAILEEGAIDVEIIQGDSKRDKILLNPNEKLVYYKETKEAEPSSEPGEDVISDLKTRELPKIKFKDAQVVENVQTELYTSWKDQRWIIEGEKLSELAPLLERRYNIQIAFLDEYLKNYKFSGTIENETVDQIFDAIQLTAPINYKINKDTVKLTLNINIKDEFRRITTPNN